MCVRARTHTHPDTRTHVLFFSSPVQSTSFLSVLNFLGFFKHCVIITNKVYQNMPCGTLLNNNFNTVTVSKMPDYTKFYSYPGFFLNTKYVHEKRFDTGFKVYVTSRMPKTSQNCILKEIRHTHTPSKKRSVFLFLFFSLSLFFLFLMNAYFVETSNLQFLIRIIKYKSECFA